MGNFIPQGIIKIGRVPFDNSYRHTVDVFSDRSEQASYFAQRCNKNLDKYTYLRPQSAIRVEGNAEEYYTYNYVMFQNANYGTKWFYAFITDIVYMNENATMLVIELDVLQTWWFDWTLKKCFVEREHVNDDTIGANLIAEPAMDMEYAKVDNNYNFQNARYAVYLVNAYPHWNQGDTDVTGSDPVSGDVYFGQYSACKYLVYDLADNDSVKKMKNDLDAYNKCGAADTIADAFTCSSREIGQDDLRPFSDWRGEVAHVYEIIPNREINTSIDEVKRITDFDGYVPNNNKLFTYPYTFMEIGDYAGRVMDYRYEFGSADDKDNGQLTINFTSPLCPSLIKFIWVDAYNGDNTYHPTHNIFTVDIANKIPWVYSAYENWAAQNAMANQLAVIGSAVGATFSIMPGVNAASSVLGNGIREANILENAGFPNFASMGYQGAQQRALSAGVGNISKEGLAASALGMGSTFANVDRMKKVPNQARGAIAGNAAFQAEMQGWYRCNVRLYKQFAQVIDGFFDMYGYQVDAVKKPNLKGRASWNYVKCQNSANNGNVPAPDMSKINHILDSGLTIWHTSDVGNYSLDNSIA